MERIIKGSICMAILVASIGAQSASAACSHSTRIFNDSGTTLRIVELKSSYAAPFFKRQWTGLKVISPGTSGTISWTSDLDCSSGGVDNEWDVKLIRQNGNVHYCSELGPGQDVSLDTPDLCFRE